MREFSQLEQRLLNEFQHGLPLTAEPFADIARQLGVYETTVLETLQRLGIPYGQGYLFGRAAPLKRAR